MENYNQDSSSSSSFWQFSDQLRLESSNFVNLSLNDTIWGNSVSTKKPEQRRNFDIRVGGDRTFSSSSSSINKNNNIDGSSWNSKHNGTTGGSDYLNGFNDGWKIGTSSTFGGIGTNTNNNNNQKNLLLMNNTNVNINGGGGGGGFSKDGGVYSKFENNNNNMSTTRINNNNNKKKNEVVVNHHHHEGKFSSSAGKKNNTTNSTINNNNNNSVDKRFKTLPPSESLAKNQSVGGYIFVCNNDTMQENLQRQLFGLPPRYRDSVRAITPGLPLFLYNYSTHQLHGIFEASSFGGTNIDPTAWEDKKCPGESRFPAQVRVLLRKICEPLEEDSFRPVLHHYDGPKFRLELNVPEALALLDIFAEKST